MDDRERCDEMRALLPELALEVLPGRDRARVLGHVARCFECRRHVTGLIEVADELLLLAPSQEPPVGLESRVVEKIRPRRRRRWRRMLAAAAVLIAAGSAGATGVLLATGQERELGATYRRALEVADGRYFGAYRLHGRDGTEGGHVFGYAGAHPWVLVVVDRPALEGPLEVEIVMEDGRRLPMGRVFAANGRGGWGGLLPVALRDVAGVRLVSEGGVHLEARFTHA